jgi:hypothetical protein
MARRKADNEEVKEVEQVAEATEKTIIFKATRPLTTEEHKQLSDKIRYENEKSGVKVVLMPYSCEVGE